MSHGTAIPVSPALEQSFKSAVEGGSRIRLFQIVIQNETLVASHTSEDSSPLEKVYDSMANLISETQACYFLVRLDGNKSWLMITYVPNGVAVKDKMVYAATKGTLKNKLGFGYFQDEVHATNKEELSYSRYKGDKAPVDSRSEAEKLFADMHKQEESERTERVTARPMSGGYHSVIIPLADNVQSAVSKFKGGEINFIEMMVSSQDGKETISASNSKMVPPSQLSKEIISSEPRFYLYSYGVPVPKNVYIYCCPEKSPPKLRMVYSTAKPAVADQLSKLGVTLAQKKIEISTPEDMTEEYLRGELTSSPRGPMTGRAGVGASSAPEYGGQVKAVSTRKVDAHPIYSLMAPSQGGSKKKIVMPPPGAYQ